MFTKTINKKWFTLVEVLFVCSIFAIMVVWIILAINRSYSFMNNVRLQVRATNFAREWVEMMFNIRDTNRRKYSWKKDEFRLCLDDDDDFTCNESISEWLYRIEENSVWNSFHYGNDRYIKLSKIGAISESDKDNFYNDWFWDDSFTTQRSWTQILFTWTYSYLSWWYQDDWTWTWEQMTWSIEDLLWNEAEFYRLVRVYGIYCKNSNNSNSTSSCANKLDPKEMRFCVKVFYRNLSVPHSTELCSIMTNFEK